LLQGDVSALDSDACSIKIDRARGGRVDILVNNSGVMLTVPLAYFTRPTFVGRSTVNVKSIFLVRKSRSPACRTGGPGGSTWAA